MLGRVVVFLAAIALAAGVGLALRPADAAGDAVGCTWAPYGDVCIFVWGSGRYVHHVQVDRNKIDYSGICYYQGHLTVSSGGSVIYSRWSPKYQGCTPLKAWFDWWPNRSFPDGSTICTAFYERGELQGKPCEKIHA
jgi:hypothetical protein